MNRVTETQSPKVLISVTDKSGIVAFAAGLAAKGFTILSTGGTAQLLKESAVPVTEVATFTGAKEVMAGRVKTLHPMIHGGILMDRQNTEHQADATAMGTSAIDMVVVNLYDFAGKGRHLKPEEAIEHIDIGGPTMLRAAAKNCQYVTPVCDPSDYDRILAALDSGGISQQLRHELAGKTFALVSRYDQLIAAYFQCQQPDSDQPTPFAGWVCQQELRYGENPHQKAGFYTTKNATDGLQNATILQGKPLSYNNYLDINAATALADDLVPDAAVVIVKHTNPCGVAAGNQDVRTLFADALRCDPKSAFGGIVACNRPIDAAAAEAMCELFLECIAAPEFSPDAQAIFKAKKNLRLLKLPFLAAKRQQPQLDIRSIRGGFLVQDSDQADVRIANWQQATERAPDANMKTALGFAAVVAKHVKSNAIVFAQGCRTVAVGAGQMSRVDAAQFAIAKAREMGHDLRGSVMASDAFFPFRDTVDLAAAAGAIGIIQPGGSLRDKDSIAACDEHGLAMILTATRQFRH